MKLSTKRFLPVGAALVVAALTATVGVPVSSAQTPGVVLQVTNPKEGDYMPKGFVFISGVACDPTSTRGAGITRVAAYLGNRDTLEGVPSWRPGGFLARTDVSAAGLPTSGLTETALNRIGLPTTSGECKQENAGWRLRVLLSPPRHIGKSGSGRWDLHVYALSTSGKEAHTVVKGLRINVN
jgi:hypothetical protein